HTDLHPFPTRRSSDLSRSSIAFSPSTRSSRRTATWKPTASSGRSSPRSELDGSPTEPDLKLKRKGSCRTGYDIMSFRIRSTDGRSEEHTSELQSHLNL